MLKTLEIYLSETIANEINNFLENFDWLYYNLKKDTFECVICKKYCEDKQIPEIDQPIFNCGLKRLKNGQKNL